MCLRVMLDVDPHSHLKHFEGIMQRLELHIQIVHEILDLRLRIQHLNALRVWIVAHAEGPWDCVRIFSGFQRNREKECNSKLINCSNWVRILVGLTSFFLWHSRSCQPHSRWADIV